MTMPHEPFDLSQVKPLPLAERKSLSRIDDILIDPDSEPAAVSEPNLNLIESAAEAIRRARQRDASVMLIYGAHLIKNGAALILDRLLGGGWVTHLATNGAGTIHDWEFAWNGESTESVKDNVATGTFGTWDETATNIQLALMTGGLEGLGYGESLGRYLVNDGATIPNAAQLAEMISAEPEHRFTAARADMLSAIRRFDLPPGRREVVHRYKHASVVASAYRHSVPLTVHPGIGYDIISNHPIFSGSVLGRAAEIDFKWFATAVDRLDGGVVLNVGSAIMGPQVFEKTISCVNNVRLNRGRAVVSGHEIFVVDIQDGGNWDWTRGEPPKEHPAYYLRFCKSYSRMGGTMRYVQCDNVAFVQRLLNLLN